MPEIETVTDDAAKSVQRAIREARRILWINPVAYSRSAAQQAPEAELIEGIADARNRMARFAPLLAKLFPELTPSGGRIGSPLISVDGIAEHLNMSSEHGRLFVKADHELAVAGSIKARGGSHAVMEIAERIALENGLLDGSDYAVLDSERARAVFSHHSISVGSTGNLGLSVGIFASQLGFSTTVHMSDAAKLWKKALLRKFGATVIEHDGDYEEAVAAGRSAALHDTNAHFIDDENSLPLLFGYATAIQELAEQLQTAGVLIDKDHPLVVYVPCGVGGAPAGIALGLAVTFGPAARCFFVEPVQAPCVLNQMLAKPDSHPSIYDAGLSGRTEADGLAVPRASLLATAIARPYIDGILTLDDAEMLRLLALAHDTEGLQLEPSAAAGFAGPSVVGATLAGRDYWEKAHPTGSLHNTTHLVWTTGGRLLPAGEHAQMLERGRPIQA